MHNKHRCIACHYHSSVQDRLSLDKHTQQVTDVQTCCPGCLSRTLELCRNAHTAFSARCKSNGTRFLSRNSTNSSLSAALGYTWRSRPGHGTLAMFFSANTLSRFAHSSSSSCNSSSKISSLLLIFGRLDRWISPSSYRCRLRRTLLGRIGTSNTIHAGSAASYLFVATSADHASEVTGLLSLLVKQSSQLGILFLRALSKLQLAGSNILPDRLRLEEKRRHMLACVT